MQWHTPAYPLLHTRFFASVANLREVKKRGKETMATTMLCWCNSDVMRGSHSALFLGVRNRLLNVNQICVRNRGSYYGCPMQKKCFVCASTEGSAKSSSKSDETIPSWAKPDSDEPPPWAREDGKKNSSKLNFELPFIVYLLASAVTAIAAIGSIFEYVNQRPVFGTVNSDSIFYAPLLGFFVITGIPASAFLWFKSVQVANKEAEDQDRRDGYL